VVVETLSARAVIPKWIGASALRSSNGPSTRALVTQARESALLGAIGCLMHGVKLIALAALLVVAVVALVVFEIAHLGHLHF
jgi:hypothetical protein